MGALLLMFLLLYVCLLFTFVEFVWKNKETRNGFSPDRATDRSSRSAASPKWVRCCCCSGVVTVALGRQLTLGAGGVNISLPLLNTSYIRIITLLAVKLHECILKTLNIFLRCALGASLLLVSTSLLLLSLPVTWETVLPLCLATS